MNDQAKPLGVAAALGLVLLFLVLYLVPLLVIVPLIIVGGVRIGEHEADLIQLAFAWPLTIWIGMRVTNTKSVLTLRLPDALPTLPLVLGSIGAAVLILAAADILFASAVPVTDGDDSAKDGYLALLVASVVVAPLGEEMLYRGVLLRGLLRRYSVRTSIAISTGLFALFHLNPGQAFIAIPLGIVYAWLTLRTSSLLPAIISHAAVNATAYAINAAGPSTGWVDNGSAASGAVLAGVAIVTGLSGIAVWRNLREAHLVPTDEVAAGA